MQNDTRRFDVHPPCKLYASHPDVSGGFGVVTPGQAVHLNAVMLAAYVPNRTFLVYQKRSEKNNISRTGIQTVPYIH